MSPPGEPDAGRRLPPDARAALDTARQTLAATAEVEGLQAWLDAAAALRDASLAPDAQALLAHSNVAVRQKARETLERLGVTATEASAATIPNPLAASELPAPTQPVSALLTLASGEVELALLPADAPATVARFISLAERGYYDGVRFHRVVPAFVAQTGDPRGDGYGGPGYSQRCEDNRVPYERGTVGMALAGRDTGGSQFFITQAAQPHLDGRYTAFGRVVRGMDLVDQVLVNDVVLRVRIQRGTGVNRDTAR